jgi:hypothetical protein
MTRSSQSLPNLLSVHPLGEKAQIYLVSVRYGCQATKTEPISGVSGAEI